MNQTHGLSGNVHMQWTSGVLACPKSPFPFSDNHTFNFWEETIFR